MFFNIGRGQMEYQDDQQEEYPETSLNQRAGEDEDFEEC